MHRKITFPSIDSYRMNVNFSHDADVPTAVCEIFKTAHVLIGQLVNCSAVPRPVVAYINGDRGNGTDQDELLFQGYPFGLNTIYRTAITLASRPNKRDKANPQLVAYVRDSIIMNKVRILDIQAGQLLPGQTLKKADLEHIGPINHGGFNANIGRLTIRAVAPTRQIPSRPGLGGTPSTLEIATPTGTPVDPDIQDMSMADLVETISATAPWISDLQRRLADLQVAT